MIALFSFGAVGFWILSFVAFVLLMLFVQFEKFLFAIITLGAALSLMFFLGNSGVGIVEWVTANPLKITLAAVGYILAGTGWSLGKWFLFVVDRKEKLVEFRSQWEFHHPDADFKRHFNSSQTNYVRNEGYLTTKQAYGIPEPRDHKGRILGWMCWWPWSLLNAVLFDFFRRAFNRIYNSLTGVFRGIAKRVYGDVLNDILEAEKGQPAATHLDGPE